MKKELLIKLFLLPFLLTVLNSNTSGVYAQQPDIDRIDFSTIKVDEMSDMQIEQMLFRAEQRGLSLQDLEAEAIYRGMPYSEVMKLRSRIEEMGKAVPERDRLIAEPGRMVTDWEKLSHRMPDTIPDTIEVFRVFGQDFFNRENLTFEPSLNIPTPRNYILSSGDELIIDVWGASQQNYEVTVSPDGFIRISRLGNIPVSGLTIEEASKLIISKLSTIYSGLKGPRPNTFANVSLGHIRSIKVSITGEAFLPGTYTLPSFSTVFNALYMAGGPNDKGSFRRIKLIRDGEIFSEIDLYDFLAKGKADANVRLKDEDIIFIPTYENRIEFNGEVKRPAIYELKDQETLEDLVNFSGGFGERAYTQRLKVFRKTPTEQKILDVDKSLFSSFLMHNGDSIYVEPILKRYENLITIKGAVFREGKYAFHSGITLTDLISKADGLREDAFIHRASIYRQKENLRVEVLAVDLGKVIDGIAEDPLLKREDLVHISSIFELEEALTVRITGEVGKSGDFPYSYNMSLGELIRNAGGLKESASLARVEVARRISKPDAIVPGRDIAEVYTFPLDENLKLEDEASSFVLHPFDIVFVRRSPGYVPQKVITIEGEVAFPGKYSLKQKDERISDLLARAGGLTDEAYVPGATLIRKREYSQTERMERLRVLESLNMQVENNDEDFTEKQSIGINLDRILQNPYSIDDLILLDGDVLKIPLQLETVRISGGVLYPVTTRYQRNVSVRGYISRAGGFADNAKKRRVFVIYPDGSVDRTRSFMFIRNYPSVEPGVEIMVPQKPEREPLTMQETLAISSSITSLALIIVNLLNQL